MSPFQFIVKQTGYEYALESIKTYLALCFMRRCESAGNFRVGNLLKSVLKARVTFSGRLGVRLLRSAVSRLR